MRIKRGVNAVKKRRKILKLAKGYFGGRSKRYRVARQAVMKSQNYAYIGRKLKKRDFRQLWIARINAAARLNGLSYSKLMFGLKNAGIEEHVRFHDLRHTFSTLAIQSGIDPKTVAEILGHASAEFSLDVYTHVTAGMKKEAAQKISGFMASVG